MLNKTESFKNFILVHFLFSSIHLQNKFIYYRKSRIRKSKVGTPCRGGAQVQPLIKELRSLMLRGVAKIKHKIKKKSKTSLMKN